MLILQKYASDQTIFRFDFSSSSIASTSTTVFVPPDKGKFILGAPPKLDKKETKNPRAKKGNTQKPKQKM